MTDPFAHLDAAYALGALEPGEAAEYEAHLRSCPECRAQLDDALATVALLAGVAEPELPEAVPDTLLPALLRRAQAERRRGRITAAAAGLVAACVIALAWLGWSGLHSDPAARTSAPIALTALHGNFIEATAALTDRPWGTQITVHCRYEEGVTGSRPYRLVVVDQQGDRDDAGSWQLGPGQTIDYTAGTAVRRERIAKVQVTLGDGTPILQLVL